VSYPEVQGLHVVVGGCGLLGSFMVKALLKTGARVRVVDARVPRPGELPPSVEFHRHRLGDMPMEDLVEALSGALVVFTMVTADVMNGTKKMFTAANEVGIARVVEACKRANVPRLVHTSSIAVTNHFINSCNQAESDGLPPWETYWSPYDITKRRGEECVLAANSSALATCALRPGCILASTNDYQWRFSVNNRLAAKLGLMISIDSAPIDFIYAEDLCRALLLAGLQLAEPGNKVAGQALFVTKSKDSPMTQSQLSQMFADVIGGWQVLILPDFIFPVIGFFIASFTWLKSMMGLEVPGLNLYQFMDMGHYAQTFDNSRAEALLGFTPAWTVRQALHRMASQRREQNSPKPAPAYPSLLGDRQHSKPNKKNLAA